jgi:hypothetical protein
MNVEPTKQMQLAGSKIANDLTTASLCKSMGGLGGSMTWEDWIKSNKSNPNLDIIERYVIGEIDSVTAIYIAMKRAEE